MEMSEGRCKPNKDEFVISDEGIMHRPTEYSFVPFPGNPTHGSIREGMIGKVLSAKQWGTSDTSPTAP